MATRQEILESIEQLPVLELVALVKEMQDKWGVSAAARLQRRDARGGRARGGRRWRGCRAR